MSSTISVAVGGALTQVWELDPLIGRYQISLVKRLSNYLGVSSCLEM